jgi:hypothetical protein
MKKQTVKPGRILCLCIIALAIMGCSGKNNAGQTDQTDKVAELTKQLETVTAELESAQTRTETTGRERSGRGGRNAPNEALSEEQSHETQAPLAETPAAATDAPPPAGGATTAVAVAPQNPPAQTPAPVTTPRYAIGDKGPAGGIVFYASGNSYKEASPPGSTQANLDQRVWKQADFQELKQIYQAIQRNGTTDYGAFWYIADTKYISSITPPAWEEDYPGYRIILAKGGGDPSFWALRMSDGREGVLIENSSIGIPKEGGGFDVIHPIGDFDPWTIQYPDGTARARMIFVHSF